MTTASSPMWRLLTGTPSRRVFEWLTRHHAIVFMLHRFRDDRLGSRGHDPEGVAGTLGELRRRGYAFLELEEMMEELLQRPSGGSSGLRRAVAFTMDDGYEDQARVGGDVFRAHDCPVTTFLITGFLDGSSWMWWDKIEYVVEESPRDLGRFSFLAPDWVNPLPDGEGRASLVRRLVSEYFRMEPTRRGAALRALADHAGVEIPTEPPPRFAPMSWEQAREWEGKGMRFAPHTVSHPVLSELSEDRSRAEMARSWLRLREELRAPVPVFAYPHGRFQRQEERILSEMGMAGAVGDRSGINHPRLMRRDPLARYRVRRIGLPEDLTRSLLYASGLSNVVGLVRNGHGPERGMGAG